MIDVRSKNWRCWIFGHRADEIAADHGDYSCVWCSKSDYASSYEGDPVAIIRFDGIATIWREILFRLKPSFWRWWRSFDLCPVCGEPRGMVSGANCRHWCADKNGGGFNDIPF